MKQLIEIHLSAEQMAKRQKQSRASAQAVITLVHGSDPFWITDQF
jgi:hypothetical protein